MPSPKQINAFIASQKSIQFYLPVQKALKKVLSKLNNKEFELLTKNLILMVLHEGALGQVTHFPNPKDKFKILQLTLPKNIPQDVLEFVIAHELGHIIQGRNWKESDGSTLEKDADNFAAEIGFPKTKNIARWMDNYKK